MDIDFSDVVLSVYPDEKLGMVCGKIPSGIQAVHVPTGLTVVCTDSRHMHVNRKTAIEQISYIYKKLTPLA